MKIIQQYHDILYPKNKTNWIFECKKIEQAGRTAYKSESNITGDSYKLFIKKLLERGHTAPIEFGTMMIKFVTDRALANALERHRLCSFLQESTIYCNYSKDKFEHEIKVVKPSDINDGASYDVWYKSVLEAEAAYMELTTSGKRAQTARAVLPLCTKTELVVQANFRQWLHILDLRAFDKADHDDMRSLMLPVVHEVCTACPEVFGVLLQGQPDNAQ